MFKQSTGFKKIREDYQRERWRYATETFDLEEADPEDIREFDLDEGWGDNDLPVMTGRDHGHVQTRSGDWGQRRDV